MALDSSLLISKLNDTEITFSEVNGNFRAIGNYEDRDPGASIKSLNYFKLITTKYPNTKYAKDAKLKIHFLKNILAKNELNVGCHPAFVENNEFGKIRWCGSIIFRALGERDA